MGISFQPVIAGSAAKGSNEPWPAIDLRFTFARKHVEEVGADTTQVLGVKEVLENLAQSHKSVCDIEPQRKAALLRRFFIKGQKSDTQTYLPVRVQNLADPREVKGNLTELIVFKDGQKACKGVILSARTGAGKSVASLKAFLDCFTTFSGEASPSLAGYLPCWISLTAEAKEGTIAKLVARTLGQVDLPSTWIEHSPKLLLFFDLNPAAPEVRRHIATQLEVFQREHGPRGHRCIVAYRSTESGDQVMNILRSSGQFEEFDLEDINTEGSLTYLRGIREFEAEVCREFGIPVSDRNVVEECRQLEQLVRRHITGSRSLISTPLLMHLASMLDADRLKKTRTLADLYRHVVDRIIDRNMGELAKAIGPSLADAVEGPRKVLAAMGRMALVMLRAKTTQIGKAQLPNLLEKPKAGKKKWWPRDDWWHGADYYTREFNEAERKAIREFSFLRADGNAFRFLHDSFIYYFAARTLREFNDPNDPGPDENLDNETLNEWAREVAKQISIDPNVWLLPAEFLGGMLADVEQAKALTGAFISAEPAAGQSAVLLQLLRSMGRMAEEDKILRPVFRFVNREQHRLAADPDRLYQELYNELAVTHGPTETGHWLKEIPRPKHAEVLLIRSVPMQRSRTEIRRFEGHKGQVCSVCFSSDGLRVLSGSSDNTIRLWDVETSREIQRFEGHARLIYSVCFSPDGQRVLSGSEDNTIRLWEVETGKEIRPPFEGHTHFVVSVSFSPDGRRILSGSWDNTIRLWDVVTGEEIRRFEGHTSAVYSACFSPDGQWVLSSSDDSTIRLWEVGTAREVRRLEGYARSVSKVHRMVKALPRESQELKDMANAKSVHSVCFSPNGITVLGECENDIIRLWDTQTGSELLSFKGQKGYEGLSCLCFSPDGQRILTTESDSICLREAKTGRVIQRFDGHTSKIFSACFSPDGRHVLSGSDDGTIRLWEVLDVDTGKEMRPFEGHAGSVGSICFSPDGRYILSSSDDSTIRLWNVETGVETRLFKEHVDGGESVCFSPDGRKILNGSGDSMCLREVDTGQVVEWFRFPRAGHGPAWCRFSPDGQRLLHIPGDNTIWLRDVGTGREIQQFKEHASWSWISFVCFSPDGRCAVSKSWDCTTRLWEVETGNEIWQFQCTDPYGMFCFSPDGQRLLTVESDSICLREAKTGKVIRRFEGHTSSVCSVCFSPDGRRFVMASGDHTARVWDAKTGEELACAWVECDCQCAMFSPDGTLIVAGDQSGQVHFWRIEQVSQLVERSGSHANDRGKNDLTADGFMSYPDMSPPAE